MAKATKIEAVVETKRVVRQPERVLLELTPLEAHAVQRLCSLVGGCDTLRNASDAVSAALENAGVESGYLAYEDGECRGYSPAASSNSWKSDEELPRWQRDRLAALVRRSEGLE